MSRYFFEEVYYVVDTVVDQLIKDPKRHFIYVETGFCECRVGVADTPASLPACASGVCVRAGLTGFDVCPTQSRAGGTSSQTRAAT